MRYAQMHEKGVENVSQLITELLASRQNSRTKKNRKLSWLNLFDRWEKMYPTRSENLASPRTWALYIPGAQQKSVKKGEGSLLNLQL